MAVTITAALLSGADPRPVQVVLSGLTAGQRYAVTGSAAGFSWAIPGGSGVVTSSQVVLVDSRGPLNVASTYVAVVDGAAYYSAAVTVAYAGRWLAQSLNGLLDAPCDIAAVIPRQYVTAGAVYAVPGRARPPARYAAGGAGGGVLTLRTTRAGTAAMEALLGVGSPIVLRTDGTAGDLRPVDILLAIDVSSEARGLDRIWTVTYTLIDDPEPSTLLGATTWDGMDTAIGARTWTALDTALAGRSWDQLDTLDWGTL